MSAADSGLAPDEAARTTAGPALEALRALRHFEGAPAEFWSAWLEASARLCAARRLLLLARREGSWRVFQQWPLLQAAASDTALVQRLADLAAEQGFAEEALATGESAGLSIRVELSAAASDAAIEATVLVALLSPRPPQPGLQALLRLAADVPAHYELSRSCRLAFGKSERLLELIGASTRIAGEPRFMQAALGLCNEVAARFGCDRVALGWLDGPYVRLQAVSHIEKFDRQMEAGRQLESAMEEALDQDEDVVLPAPPGSAVVVRTHEQYARMQGIAHLVSLPLRLGGVPLAVLTAERNRAPFPQTEIWEMRLLGDASVGALRHLQRQQRWIGARAADALRELARQLSSVEHSLAKLVGLLAVCVPLALALIPMSYRVEAGFTLRSKDVAFVPAPFDGYIASVHAEIGDVVARGALLADLDRRELALEEASAGADVIRYGREAEKAMSTEALADMQIAAARREQALARQGLVRYNLAHTRVVAPMDGVVVEGDLKARLAASVRKGDLLFKVARLENTYAEVEVPEAEVHEIRAGQHGEIAFVGRPDLRLPVRIERVDPVASFKGGKNLFLAKALIEVPTQDWWRPGMAGTAKIDVGERPLIWILTHRTLRFLQKVFWL